MKTGIVCILVFFAVIAVSCKPRSTTANAPAEVAGQQIEVQKMITAKVFIRQGLEEEFIKSAQWIIDNTHKEEGCLEYTLYRDPYNKSNFFFFERYKSQAAVDAHFAASYFKEFGTKVADMISQPTEIKIWDIFENK